MSWCLGMCAGCHKSFTHHMTLNDLKAAILSMRFSCFHLYPKTLHVKKIDIHHFKEINHVFCNWVSFYNISVFYDKHSLKNCVLKLDIHHFMEIDHVFNEYQIFRKPYSL